MGSGLVQDALTSDFAEASSNKVELPEQRPEIVEKVAEYLMYKEKYSHSKENVPDFKDRVKPETALELSVFSLSLSLFSSLVPVVGQLTWFVLCSSG